MSQLFGRVSTRGVVGVLAVGLLVAVAVTQPLASAAPAFVPAPHRNPPIVHNAGTAGKPLRIVSLVPMNYPNATQLLDFGTAISSSSWLAMVSSAWNIPGPPLASVALKVGDMPGLVHHNRTVARYQDYVFRKARHAGIGKLPGYQTVYILYIPCSNHHGMDADGCVSHHPSLKPGRHGVAPPGKTEGDLLFTQGDSLAVVLKAASLNQDTGAASHELAEAATNTPGVGQWRLHTDHPDAPWLDAPPWIRKTGTIELADMSAGTDWYEHLGAGETFRFQRIYSDTASSAGGDPDVPPSPYPYYNVFTEKDWLPFNGAHRADVSVKGWSSAPLSRWKLTAEVATWKGEASGAADPCALAHATSWQVKNGTSVDVVVTVAHPNGPASWCTLTLTSTTTAPPSHGDTSHFWNVGLMVGRA